MILLGLIFELLGFIFIGLKDWFIEKSKKDKDFNINNHVNTYAFFVESFWLIAIGVLFQIIATFIQLFSLA